MEVVDMKRLKIDPVAGIILLAVLIIILAGAGIIRASEDRSIWGQVTDARTGEPLPGVIITAVGTDYTAVSDSNGIYIFVNLPPGTYTLAVDHNAYLPCRVEALSLRLNESIRLGFSLTSSRGSSDDLLGRRLLMEQNKPTSNVVISKEQLEAMPTQNVQDLILSTEGVEKRSGEVAIRGGRACGNEGFPPAHGGNTPPNGEPVDAMFFRHYGVNPFISTEDDKLSTFAIDVDEASYIMTRSYLHDGNLPPQEAVRVEEFVNHFDYGYQAPSSERFSLFIDGSPSPFGRNYRLLQFGIKGRVIPNENRRPAVLTFVVDVSGSMAREDRLGTVRKSLRMLVDQLNDDDLVGIVAYGSVGYVVLEHTSISQKETIIRAIEMLQSSGSTNAEEGLVIGYNLAEKYFKQGSINRIILCSDGVANVGRTGAEDILKRIESQVKKGITLSSIGFGMGNYNDIMLEKLGNKGNGYYAYVDNLEQARKIFVDNLTGSLEVIAKDVKIQVEFDETKVDHYRLLGYENRDVADEDFRNDAVDGGELGPGHSCTALYEVRLKDSASGSIGKIAIRFKNPDTDEVTEISRDIQTSQFAGEFESKDASFRLAAVAAEFAEVLRGSIWAKETELSALVPFAQRISNDMKSNSDAIELMDLISKAAKLKDDKDNS